MTKTGLRSMALKTALSVLNFFAAAALNVVMWRNDLWRENRWTKRQR